MSHRGHVRVRHAPTARPATDGSGLSASPPTLPADTSARCTTSICTLRPLPLVQGDTLMWRDEGHLTVTFTR
jgi:hypothetical protein